MSDSTRADLDRAISAHVADEYEGDMVMAWVLVAETSSLEMLTEGEGAMVIETRDMQSNYLTNGLLYSSLTVNGAHGD